MRLQILILTVAVMGLGQSAAAAKKADFIKGRYTKTVQGCTLDALAQGSVIQNHETIPDMMDAKGFTGWQRRCVFEDIKVVKPDEAWTASMNCVEDQKESTKTFTFTKGNIKGTIDVVAPGQSDPDTYFYCVVD
ncbi:MAG: hypothetical protein ACRBCJ_09830 [Hyphomicrobiaceae bacterium]